MLQFLETKLNCRETAADSLLLLHQYWTGREIALHGYSPLVLPTRQRFSLPLLPDPPTPCVPTTPTAALAILPPQAQHVYCSIAPLPTGSRHIYTVTGAGSPSLHGGAYPVFMGPGQPVLFSRLNVPVAARGGRLNAKPATKTPCDYPTRRNRDSHSRQEGPPQTDQRDHLHKISTVHDLDLFEADGSSFPAILHDPDHCWVQLVQAVRSQSSSAGCLGYDQCSCRPGTTSHQRKARNSMISGSLFHDLFGAWKSASCNSQDPFRTVRKPAPVISQTGSRRINPTNPYRGRGCGTHAIASRC